MNTLKKFLKKLSSTYNKEVKVCIHPQYNIKEHQKNLPDFEVIKFKTRDLIYKAFIVTFFDSSSVIDAILLKKKNNWNNVKYYRTKCYKTDSSLFKFSWFFKF